MGCQSSMPKIDENTWITRDTHLCKNCHFVKKHFRHLASQFESIAGTSESAEASQRKKEIMQRQHWEPCVKELAYRGHSLSKTNGLVPQRCSYCGNFIFGLCQKNYLCQSCQILCHSTCVENIRKHCKEIQSYFKEEDDGLEVQGHQFEKKAWKFRRCAKCKNFVIAVLGTCLQCKDCEAVLHDRCISLLEKNCPSLYLSQGYKTLNAEGNLLSQNFMCPDCNTTIFDEHKDCRYCYFSKKFFCLTCHRNEEAIIPEIVLQKWCFCPHPVSHWSKLFLNYMKDHPVIAVEDITTKVMSFNGEICNIMLLLEDIKQYYDYLPECQKEFDDILEKLRKNWPTFLQRPLNFSLSILQILHASFEKEPNLKDLSPQLVECHEKVIHHVRRECQKCIRHAQKCMACDYKGAETTSENAIFYFERGVIPCKNKKCTQLNCVHRSCLKRNPFFVCNGCDTQMLKPEEFSSLGITAEQLKKSRIVRPKIKSNSSSKTEEIKIGQEDSEGSCHNKPKEATRAATQKMKGSMNDSSIGACGTSEGASAESKNIQRSINDPPLSTSTLSDKSTKVKDIFTETEQIISSFEYYLNTYTSTRQKRLNLASIQELTALCARLFKHPENNWLAGADLQESKPLSSQRKINTDQTQQ